MIVIIRNKKDFEKLKQTICFCNNCGKSLNKRKALKTDYKYNELKCKCGHIIYC